jgi:competence protein ComEC
MASIPVNAVWDNGEQRTTRTYLDYIALAKARKYSVVGRGNSTVLDGVIIEVLAPRQPLIFSNVNDNSVVVRATYGEVDFLFMGDCEADCEQDILNSGLLIDSEILKVGHHGSRTSTSLAFLSAVSPEIAVISVGENNRYGHPHQETLDKLSSNGIIYYRTDLHGTIIVETNGTSYWVITEREATTATTPPPTTQPSQTTEPAETTPLPTTKTNVEICQVIYDPPGQEPDEEMIKLCNRGSYSIDIGGWILTDGEGSYTIPMGTTISAGGSWTVYGSTYNPTGYTRGLYLNNKHDEVLLYDAGGSLVDVYSW